MNLTYSYGSSASVQPMPTWMVIFDCAIVVVLIVAIWKMYTKAGKPGWASIIPFYSNYVLFEIAGMNGWKFLLLLIPFYNIYLYFKLNIDLAHKFGKSTGFGIGLVFLPEIFYCILAFGKAEYKG